MFLFYWFYSKNKKPFNLEIVYGYTTWNSDTTFE